MFSPPDRRPWQVRLPFFYGWIIVGIGFIASVFSIGLTWAAGLLAVPMGAELQWSRSAIFFAVSLRGWLGIDRETFYDESRIAIVPMGFCYPGRDAKGGDLPPRPECAPLWHDRLLPHFRAVSLNLLVGSYAIDHYLKGRKKRTMTETVRAWRAYLPRYFPLPHPSWRNVLWMRQNPWFEAEVLPELRARVRAALRG